MLVKKQAAFSQFVARLIIKACELGFDVTLGEAYRPDFVASYYASQGKGIRRSNHELRLAIDLLLFKGGKYLTTTEDYRDLGEWWEQQSTEEYKCCWGGRFSDGNHFSFAHNGIK